MKHLTFMLALAAAITAHGSDATPVEQREFGGLKISASGMIVLHSPALDSNQASVKETINELQIEVSLENTGKEPITIPTVTHDGHIGGSYSDAYNIIGCWFGSETRKGKKVVLSPYRYEPVTLAPGECTVLPVYRFKQPIRDLKKVPVFYVHYTVDDDIAKRNGWWCGKLMTKLEEKRP